MPCVGRTQKIHPHEEITCAICLEDITESPKTLKCGHVYHTKCIKEWKIKSMTCPMCRVRITEPRRSIPSRFFGTCFYVFGLR